MSRDINDSKMTHFGPPGAQGIQQLIEQIKGTDNDIALTAWFGKFSTFENVNMQLRQEFTFRKPIQERVDKLLHQ